MISDTWKIHTAFTKIGFLGYFHQDWRRAGILHSRGAGCGLSASQGGRRFPLLIENMSGSGPTQSSLVESFSLPSRLRLSRALPPATSWSCRTQPCPHNLCPAQPPESSWESGSPIMLRAPCFLCSSRLLSLLELLTGRTSPAPPLPSGPLSPTLDTQQPTRPPLCSQTGLAMTCQRSPACCLFL